MFIEKLLNISSLSDNWTVGLSGCDCRSTGLSPFCFRFFFVLVFYGQQINVNCVTMYQVGPIAFFFLNKILTKLCIRKQTEKKNLKS